ncbi:MAG: formate dehydrogenase subunit gamma [Gammaproteobacteria bacterium]|nr:formate dehydrogenase subunit gamma [Xanthomonadales bacterium]NNM01141.1 formate dehydrogenase subunit gamma [Gammaproteobacteria bacterium]
MTPKQSDQVAALIEQFKLVPGGLMPLLHAVQETIGFIPPDAIRVIGKGMGLSRAEVHGVISFYHDFRTTPGGETTIHICRAEACQAMGARELEVHAKTFLGVDYGGTTEDGRFTLQPVYCLGNCACSPSIRIGDDVFARVTPERFSKLVGG